MKSVYVPSAILNALRAAGFEGRDFFDVNKLLNTLSPEDVSFYCFVNLVPTVVMPEDVALSFPNAFTYGGLTEVEAKTAATDAVSAPWDRIEDERTRKEVGRLVNDYCVENTAPQLDLGGNELSSEILWVEGAQLLLFTHVPIADSALTELQRSKLLYNRVMTQLTQFNKPEVLAELPIFAGYLRSSELLLKTV